MEEICSSFFDGCCTSFCFFSFVVAIAFLHAVRTLVGVDGRGDELGIDGPWRSDFVKEALPCEVTYLDGVSFSWDEMSWVPVCSLCHP